MKRSIKKLQNFFKLEAKRGYDDKAVMGGLAMMLDTWMEEARADDLSENLIQSVVDRLQSYQNLSQTSRKEVLYGLETHSAGNKRERPHRRGRQTDPGI